MTVTLTHKVLIQDPTNPDQASLQFDEIWKSMLHKADNPIEFVPSITECEIIERYADGFLREVLFYGTDRVRERVTPQRDKRRIVFELIDNPEMTVIYNEVTEDDEGRLYFVLTYVLAEARVATSGFLHRFDQTVKETAEETVRGLRRTAIELARSA